MQFNERLKRCFKPRFAILYPLAIYLVFFANSDDRSLRLGIWFILIGLFIRLWANGYAIKLAKLTTSGPYAHVRHPLYLGTILLVCGFIVMLKIYLLGVLFLTAFGIVYARTMHHEEGLLIAKFNQGYINYRSTIPALIPHWPAYPQGEKWPFSFNRLLQSQEYKLFLWMIFLVIAFHLKDEFLVEHEAPDAKIWLLMGLMCVLASMDPVLDFYRKKSKQPSQS